MAAQSTRDSLNPSRPGLSHWGVALAVAIFVISSVFSFARIQEQSEAISEREQSVMWIITSLEFEYLKLLRQLERFLPNPTAENRRNARFQLDLTWSRLPVLVNGAESEPLRAIEGFDELIAQVSTTLKRIEEILNQEDVTLRAANAELQGVFEDTRKAVHEFVIEANLRDAVRFRDNVGIMTSARLELYVSFAGVLVSFSLLIAMLIRRLRREAALLETAGDALDRAEVQTLALQDEMVERLRAGEALRRSEERFKDFAETAADWFWEMGADLRFTYLSERFEEVMGLPPDGVIGNSFDQLHAGQPDDADRWAQHAEELRDHKPFEDFELRWRQPDGSLRYLSMSGRPVFDRDSNFLGYRGVTEDITEAQRLSSQLSYQASHDSLTGLVNRREFEHRIQRVLTTSKVQHSAHALCYIDLDQFKIINDTSGHVAGDELLRQIARRLASQVRRRDTLSRLGGDEFGVLMEHCGAEQAGRLAEAMRQEVAEFKFAWEGRTFRVGASIGLVVIDEHSESLTAVLSAADGACYAAKRKGRNRIHHYRPEDHELMRRQGEVQWVNRIERALEMGDFQVFQQPIVPLGGSKHDGRPHVEFLLRMENDGELVPPGAFLPAAERYDLVTRLDRWVVRHVFAWLARNPEKMQETGLYFINFSGQSLGNGEVRDFVLKELESSGIPPERICFEVTETSAVANLSGALDFVENLKARGCKFALDDFGSGLSSFGYLKTLPVDYLKIDGMFVKDILDDPVDLAMVKSISDIGHLMGKETVAEFVENQGVLDALAEIGVDYAQGYHLGRPSPLLDRRNQETEAVLGQH